MADPETIGGAGGIGGALGWLASFLTFKGQVKDLKDSQEKLDEKLDKKQTILQCDKNIEDIKEICKEIKSDIKILGQKFDTYRSVRDLDKYG